MRGLATAAPDELRAGWLKRTLREVFQFFNPYWLAQFAHMSISEAAYQQAIAERRASSPREPVIARMPPVIPWGAR